MQFQLSPTPSQRRIRRIPTIRLQTMKHVRGNCMRNCWGGGAYLGFERTRRAEGSRRGRLAGGSPHTVTHSDQAPLVWRAPEGPEGTGGLRDRPLRAVRLACGDLAGGRARRRPEHPWGHKQHKQEGRRPRAHQAARPINTPRGARNASGTTSNTAQGRGPTGPRPQRYDSDANAQKY